MASIGSKTANCNAELPDGSARCFALLLPDALRVCAWPAASAEKILSSAEFDRFCTYRVARRRNSLVISRIFLRVLIDRCFGLPGADWRLEAQPTGQPRLVSAGGPVAYGVSLSHAAGLLGCAISRTGPLGCDVEFVADDRPQIVREHFAAEEVAQYEALAGDTRRQRFYQLWTLKEALLKADGRGLTVPLGSFWFDFAGSQEGRGPALRQRGDIFGNKTSAWRFWLGEPTVGYQMAVALQADRPVHVQLDVLQISTWDLALAAPWQFEFASGPLRGQPFGSYTAPRDGV